MQPLRTEGQAEAYKLGQIVIPFGGGARYKLNRNFDLGLELGFRKTFTDYLDDVSGNFAEDSRLVSEQAKYFGRGITISRDPAQGFGSFDAPGQMRGKSNEKDWYTTLGISVNYILAPRVKSPKFR